MEALEEAFSSTQPQESELLSLVHSRLLCTRRELKALKPGEIKYPYRYGSCVVSVSIYVRRLCLWGDLWREATGGVFGFFFSVAIVVWRRSVSLFHRQYG